MFKIIFMYAELMEIPILIIKLYTSLSPTNNFTIGFIAPKCFGQKPQPKRGGAVKPIVQLVGEILVYARQLHRNRMVSN